MNIDYIRAVLLDCNDMLTPYRVEGIPLHDLEAIITIKDIHALILPLLKDFERKHDTHPVYKRLWQINEFCLLSERKALIPPDVLQNINVQVIHALGLVTDNPPSNARL